MNTSIGIASPSEGALERERAKIRAVLAHRLCPDLMMDLSIVQTSPEPWAVLLDEFAGPVGVIPHYLLHARDRGIDGEVLLDRAYRLFEAGVAFITIHATPSRALWNLARTDRHVPMTSRGGAVILNDMLVNNREQNVYLEVLDELARAAARHGVVVNLGTTFRAATTVDGLDRAARHEIDANRVVANQIRAAGAQVVLEGPGHLRFSEIDEYIDLTRDIDAPQMPLGPIVTDAFPGLDQITNAIGGAYMLRRTRGGIINSVTSVEHFGGVPSVQHLIDALDAAHVAAHSATIDYRDESRVSDEAISRRRGADETCVVAWDFPRGAPVSASNRPGCSRCGDLCPLTLGASLNRTS